MRSRRQLALCGVSALILPIATAVGWAISAASSELVQPAPSHLILDRRGAFLTEVPGAQESIGYWPLPYAMPEKIVQATFEAEDRHYYQHPGVYLPSVLRALWQNVRNHRTISGASTLAMQVARMQRDESRTFIHKIREATEALLLIHAHGHEAVLRHYLQLAPYGNRAHGAARAALLYFNKPVEDLSWKQAAFLAALPQMPGRMNPYDRAGLARATRRSERILQGLHDRGILTGEELAQACESDLGLVPLPHRQLDAMHAALAWSQRAATRSAISSATLDLDIQSQVQQVLTAGLAELDAKGADNTSALVVDVETGDILASVGSVDYFSDERAGAHDYTRTKRSPGSALKPFIYALGVDRDRLTAATELADVPLDLQDPEGNAWLPENINHVYLGPMLLRQALGNSRNIPALRVLAGVGVEPALRFFERAGVEGLSFEPGRYGLGLAIGNLPVTLEELVGLYGVLARGGETLPLRRFLDDPPAEHPRVLGADAARLITDIIADPLARQPSFPSGSALDFDYAVAIKTGTSSAHRDAWAVAFSDRLLVGVWVGRHDARPMDQVTGAMSAGLVHTIMDTVMAERSPQRAVLSSFPPPPSFVSRTICALSGKLAGPDCPHHRTELFAPGTEPVEACPYHVEVAIDRRNGLRASESCPREVVTRSRLLDLPKEYSAWARRQHLEIAPQQVSPLCGDTGEGVSVAIREPKDHSRYLWDPDTPQAWSSVRLEAEVTPTSQEVVWIVDGAPVAQVPWPFEIRWPLTPGSHTIVAAMANRPERSRPVTVFVAN